jgi:hypothetical protein
MYEIYKEWQMGRAGTVGQTNESDMKDIWEKGGEVLTNEIIPRSFSTGILTLLKYNNYHKGSWNASFGLLELLAFSVFALFLHLLHTLLSLLFYLTEGENFSQQDNISTYAIDESYVLSVLIVRSQCLWTWLNKHTSARFLPLSKCPIL